MAVEVMAWNVLDAFSDEARARGVLAVVARQRPDAAVFSEAYAEGKETLLDDVLDELTGHGYAVVHGTYDDTDGRQDRHGIIGIVRNKILTSQKPTLVNLDGRQAVRIPLADPESGEENDFIGVHLDDRSESGRLKQTTALLGLVGEKAIIGGDFNALYKEDKTARVLRAARPIAKLLPAVDPRPDFRPPKLKRLGSLAGRLTDMAQGTTMQEFEAAGFQDADPSHQPTKGPVCIDHIVYRGMRLLSQRTHPASNMSDHRAVGAELAYQ